MAQPRCGNKDATGASTYNNDIAGIGQDDASLLTQTQSRSQNYGSALIISNPSDLDNLEFFSWGNDGTSARVGSSEIPSAGLPANADARLAREWLIQNDDGDGVGTVTVAFDLDQAHALKNTGSAADYALLIDSDGDFSNATIHTTGAALSNNQISFTSATIADGSYISLAGPAQVYPGDVSTNIALWLKTDNGPSNTADEDTVMIWFDNSGTANDGLRSDTPAYQDDATNTINGYPIVEFDSTDLMTMNNASLGVETTTLFIVAHPRANTTYRTLWRGDAEDNIFIINTGTNNVGYWDTSNGDFKDSTLDWAENEIALFRSKFDANNTVANFYKNGGPVGNTAATVDYVGADYDYFASNDSGAQPFGDIAEVIIYDTNTLSATDISKVESYLAFKYGVSLDQSTPQDYIASDGSTEMWNKDATGASTYDNGIAGIGRDDESELNQTSGGSTSTDAIMTISSPSDLDDLEFMSWGNDNGNGTSTELPSGLPANATARTTREWLVQNALGDGVGTVSVAFNLNNVSGIENTGLAGDYALLIDTDGDFSNATVYTTGAAYSNNEISFTGATISDGNYLALAGPVQSAPGGVLTDLNLWFKSDAGVTNSGDATDATAWTDQINGTVLDHNTSPAIGGTYPTYNADTYNGYPTLTFDNDTDRLGVDSTSLFPSNDFYIASVYSRSGITGSEALVSYGGANEFIKFFGSSGMTLYVGGGTHGSTFSFNDGLPHMTVVTRTGSSIAQRFDGDEVATSSSSSSMSSGLCLVLAEEQDSNCGTFSTAQAWEGDYSELIIYDAYPSATDRQKIESYLAYKYGITLDQSTAQDYIASDGTEMWDKDDTGASTYNNDIAGIGKDSAAGLDQTQSSSSNSDSALTISSPSDLDNLEFMSWGNDDVSVGSNSTEIPSVGMPANATNRLLREWLVQNDDGDGVGTVSVAFDLDVVTGLYNSLSASDYALLIDTDGDFSNANHPYHRCYVQWQRYKLYSCHHCRW